MATPVIEDSGPTLTGVAVDDSTPTYNLPSGIVSGELLVAMATADVPGSSTTFSWPAGWNEIFDTLDDNTNVAVSMAWRDATGSDGTTVTPTLSSAVRSCAAVYRISGAEAGATQPPYFTQSTNQGLTTTPDPPSITPAGGSDDYLILAFGPVNSDNQTFTGFPSGYVGTGTIKSGSPGFQVELGFASKSLTAATTENPGSFTITVARDSVPTTIAIPPAAAAGANPKNPFGHPLKGPFGGPIG